MIHMCREGTSFNEVKLEKLKVVARKVLSGQLLNDINIKQFEDSFIDGLVYELSSYVMAEETNCISRSFTYPKNWWQMFKKQYLPQWLLNKFPIQLKKKTLTVRCLATYPKLPQVFKDQRAVFRYQDISRDY